MHRSRLAALVIDCQGGDLARHAEFWSRALGYPQVPVSAEWARRYANLGPPGDEVRVLLQSVDHPSRVHLDIETDDIAAEVRRLTALGAKVVTVMERWTVMEAPSGHRFCVVHPQRPGFPAAEGVNRWD